VGQLHRTNNLEISLFARFYFRLEVITISVFMVATMQKRMSLLLITLHKWFF